MTRSSNGHDGYELRYIVYSMLSGGRNESAMTLVKSAEEILDELNRRSKEYEEERKKNREKQERQEQLVRDKIKQMQSNDDGIKTLQSVIDMINEHRKQIDDTGTRSSTAAMHIKSKAVNSTMEMIRKIEGKIIEMKNRISKEVEAEAEKARW